MDKKITYYIIAGVVLVLTVAIIIAMQGKKEGNTVNPGGNQDTKKAPIVKSESQVAQDMGKDLGGVGLPLRVTMDDNNQTVSLTPGKNLVMMLGDSYNWTITTSDDKVLAKRDVKLTDARVQAAYQAVGAGKAVLTAAGTCKKSGCDPKTQTFKMNVESLVTDSMTAEELMK